MREVVAVRYGTRRTTKSDCYLRYASYGEPDAAIVMDYFFWLVRDPSGPVVVDTGFDPAAAERRGRTLLCPPVEALARLGVDAATVPLVVLTHLHYDHTGNVGAFPRAELVVAAGELDFWTGPVAARGQFAAVADPDEVARVAAAEAEGRVRRLDGSGLVAPGIEAVAIGGHSPAQLALVVETAGGPVVLASDAVHFYEELELDRPFAIVADLAALYRGYDTLRELAARPGARLVAGHDPLVMERFPPVPRAEGLAVRIA